MCPLRNANFTFSVRFAQYRLLLKHDADLLALGCRLPSGTSYAAGCDRKTINSEESACPPD